MCEICLGNGWYVLDVPLGHPRFGQAIICKCQDDKRRAARQQKLDALDGLNAKERLRTFDSTVTPAHQMYARNVLMVANSGMITLQGKPGVGKTHLMHCAVNQAKEQGRVAVYAAMPDVLDYLRAAFNPKNEEPFEERWKLLISCDVLCLDELDEFSATDWARERFLRLIDERSRNRDTLLTIMALNGDPSALLPKVASRIMQGEVINMHSPDMRQFARQRVPA